MKISRNSYMIVIVAMFSAIVIGGFVMSYVVYGAGYTKGITITKEDVKKTKDRCVKLEKCEKYYLQCDVDRGKWQERANQVMMLFLQLRNKCDTYKTKESHDGY